MGKFKDLSNQRFGRLVVLERVANKGEKTAWRCKCDCGEIIDVRTGNLTSGRTKSCGCLGREHRADSNTKHKLTGTPIYREWSNMKRRCYYAKYIRFDRYGGRGIKVCDRWKNSFEAFYEDVSKLPHFGEKGYSLDRINNDGDYEPSNIRWATTKQQANNRRQNVFLTYNGKTQTIAQWVDETSLPYHIIRERLKRGWSAKEIFTIPIGERRNNTDIH